jgi:hypothetical protein
MLIHARPELNMARKVAYWVCTALVSLALLGSLSYLTGSEQVVAGFTRSGYPQHLRIVLGVSKSGPMRARRSPW